jgi:hypothetical protein
MGVTQGYTDSPPCIVLFKYVGQGLQSSRSDAPDHSPLITQGDLAFEDLEKLLPDDAAHVVEWLTEKVDALSTRLKAEPREDEVGKQGPGR